MYIVSLLVPLGYDNLVIIIVNTNVINHFHQQHFVFFLQCFHKILYKYLTILTITTNIMKCFNLEPLIMSSGQIKQILNPSKTILLGCIIPWLTSVLLLRQGSLLGPVSLQNRLHWFKTHQTISNPSRSNSYLFSDLLLCAFHLNTRALTILLMNWKVMFYSYWNLYNDCQWVLKTFLFLLTYKL